MKFHSSQAGDYTQQVGMTLAEIAYSDPENIATQLAFPYYAGGGLFRLEWLGVTAGNQMYVCRIPSIDQWVVVIRGSATDPFTEAFWIDWFEQDLTSLHQVPLPFGGAYNGGAMIGWGTEQGFEDLIGMTDVTTGLTLVEYLKANASFEFASIVVIGHSLGGCLASVLTPYLYETLGRPNTVAPDCFLPITFAAPTAGDVNFAGYVEDLFGGYPYRFQNSLDVIPHAWDLQGLDWVLNSYDPEPKIDAFLYGLVDATWWLLYEGSYFYTQPGQGVVDPGTPQNYYWWFQEAGYQHSGETYLSMYGAPTVVFPLPPNAPLPVRRPRAPHPRVSVLRRNPPGFVTEKPTAPPRLGGGA
jgi:hypothetical protein